MPNELFVSFAEEENGNRRGSVVNLYVLAHLPCSNKRSGSTKLFEAMYCASLKLFLQYESVFNLSSLSENTMHLREKRATIINKSLKRQVFFQYLFVIYLYYVFKQKTICGICAILLF